MTKKKKKLDYDDWFDIYKPIINHLQPDGENGSFNGCLFETYGKEDEYIRKFAKMYPNRVWTILTGVGKNDVLAAGWHYVNRFGYMISEVPFEDPNLEFEIK